MSYSLIAHTFSTGASGGSTTPAIDTTGADLLVVGIVFSHAHKPTLSDSNSNTWTAIDVEQTNVQEGVQLFYCKGGTVGAGHTFTVTGASSFSSAFVQAWSGSGTGPLDQATGNNSGTASTSIQTGSITPTQNNELVVVMYGNEGNAVSQAMDSGMTLTDTQGISGPTWGSSMGYKVQTTAAAINVTGSSNSNGTNAIAIASFFAPATAINLTPGAGSLVLTGNAPTIRTNDIAFTPSSGSLVLAGNASQGGFGLNPGAGTLTLTGMAPSLFPGKLISPSAGALTLNGVAPRMLTGHYMSPGSASLSLIGNAPSITGSPFQISPPTAQNLSLNGFAPSITLGIAPLVPFKGDIYSFPFWYSKTYEFLGYNPNKLKVYLQYRNGVQKTYCGVSAWVAQNLADTINANQDPTPIISFLQECEDDDEDDEMPKAMTISVTSTSLFVGAAFGTLAANLSVRGGKAPYTWTISPAPNNFSGFLSLVSAGSVAQLTLNALGVGHLATPLVGVVQVTDKRGTTTSVSIGIPVFGQLPAAITPPTGSLVLTGFAPTVVAAGPTPHNLTPPAGSMALNGLAPTVTLFAPLVLTPPSATLSLTGNVPTMNNSGSIFLQPPSGSLNLAGVAPTLAAPRTPASATLNLTGLVPSVANSGQQVVAIGVQNKSNSTVPANSITPIFGMAFKRGDIKSPAPVFKVGGNVCKMSMSLKRLLWDDGSLRFAAFLAMIPVSIGALATASIAVTDGGSIPASSSRSPADYIAGGVDMRVDSVGLDNLVGAWDALVSDGIINPASDNYVWIDGDCGRVERRRSPFKNGGVAHGYLENYDYLQSLQDNSGALYGLRWIPRPVQPWEEQGLGPGGANKIFVSFSALAAKNGGSVVFDLAGTIGGAQAFSIAAPGNTFNCANTLLTGQLIRLTPTGSGLPTPFIANKSYVASHQDASHIHIGTSTGGTANGNFTSATSAGSGNATAYPYIPSFCSLWGCQEDTSWNYIQGAGSVASDAPLRITFDNAYLMETGMVPMFDLSVAGVQSSASAIMVPNGAGPIDRATGDTGDRPDIGVLHTWGARHIYTQAAVDEQVVRVVGLAAANFPWCVKSKNSGGTLLCFNNGPGGTGASYPGMHPPEPNWIWDGTPNASGIALPGDPNFLTSGIALSGTSHLSAMAYYPFIMSGDPMFFDLLMEQGNFALSCLAPSSPTQIDTTQYKVGKRNPLLNGHQWYGTVWNSIQQRNGAWATRDLACASIWDHPECPGYISYFGDCSNSNAGYMSAVIGLSPNPFTQTAKIWFTDDPGVFNSPWQELYLLSALYLAQRVTLNADYLTAETRSTNWFDFGVQNCTAYVMAVDQQAFRKGNSNTSPLLDTIGLLGAHLGQILGWDAGGFITIQGQAPNGGPNTPLVPGIGDGEVFIDADLGSGVPPCRPIPGGLLGSTPYYVVQVTPLGGVNYGVKLSATPSGAPIPLTNSSHGGWNGWIEPLSGTTGTLHITSALTGTIFAAPPSNTYTITGPGVPAGCQVTAVQATAPGDIATYTVNRSASIGSAGSPIAMTGTLAIMLNFVRPALANIPPTASYDQGAGGYLSLIHGVFNLAQANGIPVSAFSLNDVQTRFNARGIQALYPQNPKYAYGV